ncbi:MAG: hypothetical protein C0403_03935, partial [Desulfobacterium sp.]|nr:hypothetical protein [Desulfobacterium sp.]
MIKRIKQGLNDGRQEIMKNNKGFTIIEMVIVIVII